MPRLEYAAARYGGSLPHHVHGPVLLRIKWFLLLDAGSLGPRPQLGEDRATWNIGGTVLPGVKSACEDCGLVGAQLRMRRQFGLARLALSCFEVNDDQPALGVDFKTVHLATKDRGAGRPVINSNLREGNVEVLFHAQQAPALAPHDQH